MDATLDADSIIATATRAVDVGASLADPGVHRRIAAALLEGWPRAAEVGAEVEGRLANEGYAVLSVPGMHELAVPLRKAVALCFSCMFGTVQPTPGTNELVWDVRSKERCGPTVVDGISTRTGAAALHTDAASSDEPDRIVGLFCLRPARHGGDTVLLRADAVEVALRREPGGDDAVAVLEQATFRFQDGERYHVLPLLFGSNPRRIRYRRDLLDLGSAKDGCGVPSDTQVEAVARLERAISRAQADSGAVVIALATDEAVVFDNHRMLHGRTPFDDTDRHLLRVRVSGREADLPSSRSVPQ